MGNPTGDLAAVIVAAGNASRMNGIDKIFLPVEGKPALRRCAEAFASAPSTAQIIVVTRPDRVEVVQELLADLPLPVTVTVGGADRQSSAARGAALVTAAPYIAIHDGARPYITPELIERTAAAARLYGAAAPAVPVTDTVKAVDGQGFVTATPDRTVLRAVQTPQIFAAARYRQLIEKADGSYTDDCQLFEQAGDPVMLVEGDPVNKKLTTPADLPQASDLPHAPSLRIGQGYDAHRLVEGRRLILCGVDIPHEKGLLGHSDADVAAHAVMDALLGAAALGDIGQHFPDKNPQYAGADSLLLARETVRILAKAGFAPANVDVTITAQSPRLVPHIPLMRQNLAAALGLEASAVSVKATTTEGMGFEGRGEGISAMAVAAVRLQSPVIGLENAPAASGGAG